jgi:hypothetical protein
MLLLRIQQGFQSPGMILCSEVDPFSCHVRVHGLLLRASALAFANRTNDRCKLIESRDTHSCDNGLQHMLSPVFRELF